MKKLKFKNLPTSNEKYGEKNVNRAIESNKNNDFLIEVAKRLVDK